MTAQTSNGTTTTQTFDTEGRITHTLTGTAITYDPFDRMLTATHAGTTATYAYWPDGTPAPPPPAVVGAASTQTFHYGTDGTLVNDTTADATPGAAATTASYLLTAGREARSLQPGTTTTGALPTSGASTPVTTGTGAGYLLRDRHSSVTALIDTTGVTVYHYSDYGAPANANGQASSSAALPLADLGVGRVNPFRYAGGTARAGYTDAVTGLLVLPARTYDATQGRFTERDTASIFNRYQGFSANPVNILDPTGHISLADILLDVGMFIAFAVATIATAGAASAAFGVIAAATEAGTAVAATTVVAAASTTVAAVASATGLAASATRLGDTLDDAVTGKHFLTSGQRKTLGTVETAAGAVAAAAGLVTAGSAAVGAAADAAEGSVAAADAGAVEGQGEDAVDSSEPAWSHGYKRAAIQPDDYDADDVLVKPLSQAPKAQAPGFGGMSAPASAFDDVSFGDLAPRRGPTRGTTAAASRPTTTSSRRPPPWGRARGGPTSAPPTLPRAPPLSSRPPRRTPARLDGPPATARPCFRTRSRRSPHRGATTCATAATLWTCRRSSRPTRR